MNLQRSQQIITQQKNTISSLQNQININKTNMEKLNKEKDDKLTKFENLIQEKDDKLTKFEKLIQEKDDELIKFGIPNQEIKNDETQQIVQELRNQNISFKQAGSFIILS